MTIDRLHEWAECGAAAAWTELEAAVLAKGGLWAGASGDPSPAGLRAIAEQRRGDCQRRLVALEARGVPASSPASRMVQAEQQRWEEAVEALDWLAVFSEFRQRRQALRQCLDAQAKRQAHSECSALAELTTRHPDLFLADYQEIAADYADALGIDAPEPMLLTRSSTLGDRATLSPPPAPVPSWDSTPTLAPQAADPTPAATLGSRPTMVGGEAGGTPPPTGGGLSPGRQVFGRYQLRRVLGRGGMGVVWLAWDEELERQVAMKFLPEAVAFSRGAVRDLKKETRRALELTHPHIVRVYDFEHDAERAAIIMEYVDGDSLGALRVEQAGGVFTPTRLAEWVRQLCGALGYAHSKGKIVHRDLKPENLIVDRAGDLKIADFGIARGMSESVSRVTQAQGTTGTLAFMSPQQLAGARPSVADDIYSLGATLYELLTGKPPFYCGDIPHQVRTQTPPSLEQRRAELGVLSDEGLPTEWEDTIAACLAKQPEDRPRSALEVVTRLGLTTDHDELFLPVARPWRRRAWRLALGALAVVTIVSVGLWRWQTPRRSVGGPAKQLPPSVAVPVRDARPSPPVTPTAPPPPAPVVAPSASTPSPAAHLSPPSPSAVAQAKTSQESQRGPVVTDSDFFDQPPAPKPAAEGPVSSATPSVPPVKPVAPGMTSETQALPRLDPAQWAWVPPGSFVMGSPNTEKERVSDEGPQTHVTFAAGFWIAKHEASQAEYEAVIGENPSQFKGDPRLPVERVSWHDATNYCARLTERERAAGRLPANLVYRLPTEAEWEYVCRAGTDTAFHQGAALRSGMANFDGRYEYDAAAGSTAQKPGRFLGRTAPVGSYPPNAWGFHDFHGNVWEWCLDWYSNARTGGRLTDPVGPATGLIRVMRGGSWANVGSNCRAAVRGADKPERKGSDLGFRVVLGPAR